jgi:hypothetical protein
MEMTFPHESVSQNSVVRRNDHKALIAAVTARQANSRTVQLLRRIEGNTSAAGDAASQRIQYFASKNSEKLAVCGAFWRKSEAGRKCEDAIYQANSAYIKDQQIEEDATGVQLTHAGHGVSRTL